jgi:Costars
LYFSSQKRLDEEINQLLIDIKRIGVNGVPNVTFGELFDDDDVQQYYEALVGTLKSAKKRGLIDYKGILLLKGVSDDVIISIRNSS